MHAVTRTGILTCALALSAPGAASDIYKCVEGHATSYQSTPCLRSQAETRLVAGIAPGRAAETPATARQAPAAYEAPRRGGPWRNRTLVLGMSDDEVLNMPGWGRPTRIVRTRAPREWREVWTYGETLAGQRELHFANARLRDIVDLPGTQIARLTVQ